MLSRYSVYGLILVAVTAAASTTSFAYITPMFASQKTSPMKIIHIPIGSANPPSNWQWGQENLSSPTFPFPVNITVTVGVNNTIEWINDDRSAHTITALIVPAGATFFDSGLVDPGKTFTVTLTVPGTYKYACVWHNWLAGVITVKPS